MFWSSVWQHVVSQPGGGPCRHHLRSAWRPSVAEPDGTPGPVCGQLTAGWRPRIWRCVESLPERRSCRSRTGLAVSGYIVVLVVIRHCRDLVIVLPVIYLPASCNNRNKFKYESKGFIAPLGTTKRVKNNTHNITVEHYTIILWIMQQFFLFFFQMGVGWGWVGWVWVGWIIDLRLLLPIQLIPILLLIQQGHATTKSFNCIRNVVVMGQMLFLDSMEKNNFQLADAYPICTFSSFCELVVVFFS